MSLEEYQARQRANAAQNSAVAEVTSAKRQIADARRHLMNALELLGPDAKPEVVDVLKKALASLRS